MYAVHFNGVFILKKSRESCFTSSFTFIGNGMFGVPEHFSVNGNKVLLNIIQLNAFYTDICFNIQLLPSCQFNSYCKNTCKYNFRTFKIENKTKHCDKAFQG